MPKGNQQSCFLVQKRASDAARSINSAIWSVFGRFQKSLFFCCRSESAKIKSVKKNNDEKILFFTMKMQPKFIKF